MDIAIQSVSSKGQLVIPAQMRRKLGLRAGTRISVIMDQDDQVIKLQPIPLDPIKATQGFLKKYDTDGKMFQRMLQQKREEIARGE